MFIIHTSDAANALHRRFVTEMTTNRIARISWVDDNATIADNLYRLAQQAFLWVIRMNFKVLAQGLNSEWFCEYWLAAKQRDKNFQ